MRPLLALAALALPLLPSIAFGQMRPNATPTSTIGAAYATSGAAIAIAKGSPVVSLDGARTARLTTAFSADAVAFVGQTVFAGSTTYVSASNTPILHRSPDGGATWEDLGPTLAARFPSPAGTSTQLTALGGAGAQLFVGVSQGTALGSVLRFARSPDGGATWTEFPAPAIASWGTPASFPAIGFSSLVALRGALYARWRSASREVLMRSSDGGATWAEVGPAPFGATNPATYPQLQYLYFTTDEASGTLYLGAMRRYSDVAAGPFDHLLYRSFDGGATWTALGTPHHAPGAAPANTDGRQEPVLSLARVGGALAAVVNRAQRGGLWLSFDEGQTWRRPVRTHNGTRYASAAQAHATAVALHLDGMLYTDAGTALPATLDGALPDPFAALGADSLRATLGGVAVRGPKRLLDSDSVFVRLNPQGNAPPSGLWVSPTAFASPAYAAMSPHTWTVTHTGYAFTAFRSCGARCRYDFPFDPAKVPNPAALLLVRRVGPFWSPLPKNLFDYGTHRGIVGPGYVRAEGDQIAGGDYALASTDPANDLSLPATDVAAEGEATGAGVVLGAPAPQPVRGAALVRFALGTSGNARLAVLDLLGREVALLHDGPVAAGETMARFDASALPAGVYVLRLAAAGAVRTQRLVVAR